MYTGIEIAEMGKNIKFDYYDEASKDYSLTISSYIKKTEEFK